MNIWLVVTMVVGLNSDVMELKMEDAEQCSFVRDSIPRLVEIYKDRYPWKPVRVEVKCEVR